MKKSLALGILFLLPTITFAAGFAKQSLFLSKTPVTEGETVLIHAVVANDAATAFAGNVVFTDADTKIGSVAVTITAGGANTVSLSWKPAAGAHSITAELTGASGTVVEKESATFSIAEKPKPAPDTPSAQSAATVDSSYPIQKDIANLSPQAASAAEPLFTVIDSARSSAADVLDTQLANTQAKLANTPKPGLVLGASTGTDTPISNPWGTLWFVLYTIYFYILTILRWLVGNAGVFYPALAILFLYMLWRIYRRIRRPAY